MSSVLQFAKPASCAACCGSLQAAQFIDQAETFGGEATPHPSGQLSTSVCGMPRPFTTKSMNSAYPCSRELKDVFRLIAQAPTTLMPRARGALDTIGVNARHPNS